MNRYYTDTREAVGMIIFTQFWWSAVQQKHFIAILIISAYLLVQKIKAYQCKSGLFLFKLLYSFSFFFLNFIPSINLQAVVKLYDKRKTSSVSKYNCFLSKPVECFSWLASSGHCLRDSICALHDECWRQLNPRHHPVILRILWHMSDNTDPYLQLSSDTH